MWSAIVSAIASIAGGLFSYFGSRQNTKQSLGAQQRENQLTREYNRELAEQQNLWNIQQWHRENQYNSPGAQKERLEAAGLNPNLMYGGISNVASSSPEMTSGAPAQSMDWSSLANRKTLGDALNESLNTQMMQVQIDSVKAQTRKTLADAGLSEVSLEYAAAKEQLGLDLTEQQFKNAQQEWEEIATKINNNREQLNGIRLDNASKAIDNAFKTKTNDALARKLAADANISEAEAENALKYFAARTLQIEAQNAWSDAAWIVQQKQGTGTLIKYGSGFAETILDSLLSNVTKGLLGKGNKPKKFDKMTQDGNVLTWE